MFRYAYVTRDGGRIHLVAYRGKAVEIHESESDARAAAAEYLRMDNAPKGAAAAREWLERWRNAPDLLRDDGGIDTPPGNVQEFVNAIDAARQRNIESRRELRESNDRLMASIRDRVDAGLLDSAIGDMMLALLRQGQTSRDDADRAEATAAAADKDFISLFLAHGWIEV